MMKESPHAIRFWDVKMPPKKNRQFKGVMVPSVKGALFGGVMQKERRIVMEIYSNNEDDIAVVSQISSVASPHSISPRRLKTVLRGDNQDRGLMDLKGGVLGPEDKIGVRILRKARKKEARKGVISFFADSDNKDDDDDKLEEDLRSMSTIGFEEGWPNDPLKKQNAWVEHRRHMLDTVKVLRMHKNCCVLKLGMGGETVTQPVFFINETEANVFCSELEELAGASSRRAMENVSSFRRARSVSRDLLSRDASQTEVSVQSVPSLIVDDHISVLVEIVAAYNLPKMDIHGSVDPYVVAFLGQQKIHRTKNLSKNSNPIFTVATNSLFLLDTDAETFFQSSGLTFVVKDFDAVGRNEIVGKFTVKHADVLQGKGERKEYPLLTSKGEMLSNCLVALRFKPAEPEDIEFLKDLQINQRSKKLGIHASETFVPPKSVRVGQFPFKRETRIGPNGTEYRVKPGPNPKRLETTKWMTASQIETEVKKHSSSWIESGSGESCKIYFEILYCDGLPKLDRFSKNDCFACVIVEDAIVSTEVIWDCNNPRWMPWSQRAFIFNVQHPSSQILLGIFDKDAEALSFHDEIGRVAIDVSRFVPGTEYTLTYDLHDTGFLENRSKKGTATIRLWMEWKDYRQAYIKSLSLPKTNYVNTPRENDFRAAHFTVVGQENIHSVDFKVLRSYARELKVTRKALRKPIERALLSVALWRGHFQISLLFPCYGKPEDEGDESQTRRFFMKSVNVLLPLHSIFVFGFGICVAEDFNLIPSFLYFSMAWLLLAKLGEQRENDNPWHHCRSYTEMWSDFATGNPSPEDIRPCLSLQQIQHESKADLLELEEKDADEIIRDMMQEEEEELKKSHLTRQIESNRKNGMIVNMQPLKKALLPIQMKLGKVCVGIRVAKSLLSWHSCLYSFVLTNICIVLGFANLWVKWDFLFHWLLRIIFWGVFGPHMKLVDVIYLQKFERGGGHQLHAFMSVLSRRRKRRQRDEALIKLRDFKAYMFGKYLTRLPVLKEYRYQDIPLPCSSATPGTYKVSSEDIVLVMQGQYVEMGMIPRWKKRDNGSTSVMVPAVVEENAYPSESDPLLGSAMKDNNERQEQAPHRLNLSPKPKRVFSPSRIIREEKTRNHVGFSHSSNESHSFSERSEADLAVEMIHVGDDLNYFVPLKS